MGRDACGGAARRLVARAARAVATSRSRSAVIVGTIVLVGYISGSFGCCSGGCEPPVSSGLHFVQRRPLSRRARVG